MLQLSRFAMLAVAVAVGAVACDDDDDTGPSAPVNTTFTVTIENISTEGTLAVPRLNGVVPLSPGVYAVYSGGNPLFTVDDSSFAGEALERLAEDGDNSLLADQLATMSFLVASGTFEAPGGPDNSPLIFPGESVSFTVSGSPGDRLQIATMFAQSNDWFIALGGIGVDLFTGSTPTEGDVSDRLVLYDAGTEADTPPGTGPDQAPVQAAPNTGEPDPITSVRPIIPDSLNALPVLTSIMRVTITTGQQ